MASLAIRDRRLAREPVIGSGLRRPALLPGAPAVAGEAGGGEADVDQAGIRACVESARAGDGDAFGDLFRAFRADVLRLCERLLASRDEAEDAASEVFLRAQRALDGYDPVRPFRTWLLSVAAHHCVDRLRRRSTERRLLEPSASDLDAVAEPGPSPLSRALRSEARRELLSAIDALPDRYRAPLALRYFADLDYASISETLGVSRNQVGTLLLRAKQRLRERMHASRALEAAE